MKYVLFPISTEKAVDAIEKRNQISFYVVLNATKKTIKEEIEKTYNEKVKTVNIINSFDGRKKAIVTFQRKGAASDTAAKLKML